MRAVVLEDKQPSQLRTQDQEGAAVEARKVGSDGYRRDRMEVLTQVLLDSPV